MSWFVLFSGSSPYTSTAVIPPPTETRYIREQYLMTLDGSVPSHVGIDGNEKAVFLARTAAEKEVSPTGYLTFSEKSSFEKIELHHFGGIPPSHPWYFGRNPGDSFKLMPRKYQTALSRLVRDHTKALSFHQAFRYFQNANCVIPSSSLLPTS
ncbi:hypothetical protein TNCV_558401 [Trichonephila clavipes]|nr:hypothetical protein TNCV_558401 [Trichonephila clavipes]